MLRATFCTCSVMHRMVSRSLLVILLAALVHKWLTAPSLRFRCQSKTTATLRSSGICLKDSWSMARKAATAFCSKVGWGSGSGMIVLQGKG